MGRCFARSASPFFLVAPSFPCAVLTSTIVTLRNARIFGGLMAALAIAAASGAQRAPANPANVPADEKDRLFRAGAEAYESGRYAEAVAPLEKLVRAAPEVFEVHELLGLVYAAQSQDVKSNQHLAKAVQLKPDSAAARSNLAASYARLGKMDLAEEQFGKAVELEPDTYEANHNIGAAYAHNGKVGKAILYLEKAQPFNPSTYDNGYDLVLAYFISDRRKEARDSIQSLIKVKDTAELHNLLAQVEEKDGNFIAAANEFQAAAHL